jgi:hypothetical protein
VNPDRFGLIIGAMKCGTTSLFNQLATHPEIAPCREKEPNFFSADPFDPDDAARYHALWSWRHGEHKVAIEASVNYSKMPSFPDCAQRIAQFPGGDFRFIYCMRNPIDRIESHVYHGLHAGWTRPLDEGISDHTVDVSRYAMQLDAYASRFGRDRIFLVVLEEFEAAPEVVLRQVCAFLEVDADFSFDDPAASHNRASDHYVEHPLWDRVRRVGPLRKLAHVVPTGLRQSIFRTTGRRVHSRSRLTASERSELGAALRPDLKRLRSEYGIDADTLWGIDIT